MHYLHSIRKSAGKENDGRKYPGYIPIPKILDIQEESNTLTESCIAEHNTNLKVDQNLHVVTGIKSMLQNKLGLKADGNHTDQ